MLKRAEGNALREGKIQHHGKFGFLLAENPGQEDLMLRGPSLRLAMDGDRVQARITEGTAERPAGEIVRVLERARKSVTGVLAMKTGRWIAVPEETDERDAVRVLSFAKGIMPQEGSVVVVKITQWPTVKDNAGGEVCELLGPRNDPGVRLRAVLRTRDLPDAFPEAVLAESRAFPECVSSDMWASRLDLREVALFTIDGADAKDFDDAVSLEVLSPELMRLGVHIADVSNYVKKGTKLDAEAAERATSVYMADRVVPMLPPNLSDHLCSLMPGVERLTLSCFMNVDAKGDVVESSLKESVIRSRRRFTYDEVELVLKGDEVPNVDPDVKESVLRMGKLYKTLLNIRLKRGALDMTMPEYKVSVDAQGRPLEVVKRDRLMSHRLIEEFMLLANETVAETLLKKHLPFLSRIHPNPDPRKLAILGAELRKLGINAPPSLTSNPAQAMQKVLSDAVGQPLEETANMLVMRSLMQASYSAVPGEHFGLASEAYCHFTSPIRRYPDLVTHRAVRALLSGTPGSELAAGLGKVAEHCSARERVAADAERRSTDILRAELLKKRVGEVFEGVVSGSAAFGLFVTLKDMGASGLVRNAAAALGSRVKVKLERVNEGKGELDLSILAPGGSIAPPAAAGKFHTPRPARSHDKPHDKPRFDSARPKWDRPKFDPSKPKWERPKFDPNKPRHFDPTKAKYDPNKPKWDPNKPKFDPTKRKFDPTKARRFDPMTARAKHDPNKPQWDSKKPKFDPTKRRFDPTKGRVEPRRFDPSKPKWDPNKPKYDPNKPKFGHGKPKFEGPKPKREKPQAPYNPNAKPKFYERFLKKPRRD